MARLIHIRLWRETAELQAWQYVVSFHTDSLNNLDGLQLVQAVSCLNDYFLGAGGLLPRLGPEGLPVLLGQFGLLLLMMLLLCSPQRFRTRGLGAPLRYR